MALQTKHKVRDRIYTRDRANGVYFYADFRDLGGKREPLKEPGARTATQNPVTAHRLYAERLEELTNGEQVIGPQAPQTDEGGKPVLIGDYVEHHLKCKRDAGKVTDRWLVQTRRQLRVAVEFFGARRDLRTIRADPDIRAYITHLRNRDNGRGGTLTDGSVRHFLNSLSNMFERVQERYPDASNPVRQLQDKPSGAQRKKAPYLEVPEAGKLLTAARGHDEETGSFMHPLLATYLLTGGRRSEVLGLEVEDVVFTAKTVRFQPNEWRRLKTKTAPRRVPLWPQLETILAEYIEGRNLNRLLFPSPYWTNEEKMLTTFRRSLDTVAERAGWKEGQIRPTRFRHTYATARLQTTDRGAPIALWTVAQEMGHSSPQMIEGVYGHPSDFRHRSEVVEYPLADDADPELD